MREKNSTRCATAAWSESSGRSKQALGFRQLRLRGTEGASIEWELASIAYNIKKLARMRLPFRVPGSKALFPANSQFQQSVPTLAAIAKNHPQPDKLLAYEGGLILLPTRADRLSQVSLAERSPQYRLNGELVAAHILGLAARLTINIDAVAKCRSLDSNNFLN